MDEICDMTFTAEGDDDEFTTIIDVFDINNDGFGNILIRARMRNDDQGRAYLYWGSSRAKMDNVADKTFTGEPRVLSGLGRNAIQGGYVNSDNYGDIYISAFAYRSLDTITEKESAMVSCSPHFLSKTQRKVRRSVYTK